MNWSLERIYNLPKDTELISGGAGITQRCLNLAAMFFYLPREKLKQELWRFNLMAQPLEHISVFLILIVPFLLRFLCFEKLRGNRYSSDSNTSVLFFWMCWNFQARVNVVTAWHLLIPTGYEITPGSTRNIRC